MEFKKGFKLKQAESQAKRCMDCGTPFCHSGCPVGNIIPEWNNLVTLEDYEKAWERLSQTNNFPELTGRICPAPCEDICTLGINMAPVNIKGIEQTIADLAFKNGWVKPRIAKIKTNLKVAVVGSGPCGLAAAQQLAREGHHVTVFERHASPGGLLTYGIPNFKLEKTVISKRLEQLKLEGVEFKLGIEIGRDITLEDLKENYQAILLAVGANKPRQLNITDNGSNNNDIISADDFLKEQMELILGERDSLSMTAHKKKVIVIGGGDTGADCVGTSARQGADSIDQIEIQPQPSKEFLKTSTSHAEGCKRHWSLLAKETIRNQDGKLVGVKVVKLEWEGGSFSEIKGSEITMPADLIIYAVGYDGFDTSILETTSLKPAENGFLNANAKFQTTEDKIFAAGDVRIGPSLVVNAIDEGRRAAAMIHDYLTH